MFRRLPGHALLPLASSLAASMRFQGQQQSRPNTEYKQMTHERRRTLPPSFELPKWNNEDLTKGYMLRVQYLDNAVILSYFQQTFVQKQGVRGPISKIAAVIAMPSIYLARILAVIDGVTTKCDVTSKMTRGTFTAGSEPGTFVLKCVTTNEDGPVEWTVDFDVPATLLLQRFNTLALQHNQGFFKQ